jgi:hypothetical protein
VDLEGEVELGDGRDDQQPRDELRDHQRGEARRDDRDRAQDDERDAGDEQRARGALQAGTQGFR